MDEAFQLPQAPLARPNVEETVEVVAEGVMPTEGRSWGKMPLTVENAARVEEAAGVTKGTYYIASARRRVAELSSLHRKWFGKAKNRSSPYYKTQRDIEAFYVSCAKAFDERFAEFIGQPSFEMLGETRKRTPPSKKKQ